MNANEILILNLEEVRRRSIKIWHGIPDDRLHWKLDEQAISCIETVRHVLKAEWAYMQMLLSGKSRETDDSPFYPRPYASVNSEIEFAAPYRKEFLSLVGSYAPEDLTA